jgi:hypothetical protein
MPATLPWREDAEAAAKKRCSSPSRSTYWFARKRTSAWAIVSLEYPYPSRVALRPFSVLTCFLSTLARLSGPFEGGLQKSQALAMSFTGPLPSGGSEATIMSCSSTYQPP